MSFVIINNKWCDRWNGVQDVLFSLIFTLNLTRKLIAKTTARCAQYRLYGCSEILWRVLTTPAATFSEICKGLLFRSILRMCVQNLKCAALPVNEIIKKDWLCLKVLQQTVLDFLVYSCAVLFCFCYHLHFQLWCTFFFLAREFASHCDNFQSAHMDGVTVWVIFFWLIF